MGFKLTRLPLPRPTRPPGDPRPADHHLQRATSTAAEQGTRHQAADADDEQDAHAEALREAPTDTFPQIAGLGAEPLSGAGPNRLNWGFRSGGAWLVFLTSAYATICL